MKLALISYRQDNCDKISYAVIEGDEAYPIVEKDIFGSITKSSDSINTKNISFNQVTFPSKVVCVGVNYSEHANEMQEAQPKEPLIFIKPSTSVVGHNDAIVYPAASKRVDYEAELAIVIGKYAKNVPEDKAKDYILGYTCLNDVTARDLQKSDGQWTRGKGFDTFCPIGPWIETELDPMDLKVESRLNGEIKQSSRTSMMMHNPYKILSYISSIMTLLPGDIIATGTPSGIGPMKVGDFIEVEVEGIGTLTNQII